MTPEEIRYLSVADVLSLHRAVTGRTGHPPARLRDEGLLESAVMRPRMAAYYEEADIIRQCAILAVGIAQAQAFLDGNKRTAFAAGNVFLKLNGLTFTDAHMEFAQQLEQVATREASIEEATARFEAWLRQRVGPRRA